MITIPNTISKEYVASLSATDLSEILETASESVIEQIMNLLPVPTQADYDAAYQILDDGIYDMNGMLISEKHPED